MNLHSSPQQSWLAAYLYYNEPWEIFLCKAVAPFIEQTLRRRLADQFFFIRYWEKGPHIRLRFKGDSRELEKYVEPALQDHFSAYFKAHPSRRTDPSWLSQAPESQRWLPDNSVHFAAYEPETARYGGETGILIAEHQFQASSQAVLSILQERSNWDYSRALGTGIQLHLGFAFALGMDLAAAALFFSKVFANWLPRAYSPYQQNLPVEEIKARRDEVLQAFSRTYQMQKTILLPMFQQIWRALENQEEFEQTWFNEWLHEMKLIHKELLQAQASGQLFTPPGYTFHPYESLSVEQQQRWAIYDSYVHMTNNRLGILNHDEGFLGYLIKQGLEELALENKGYHKHSNAYC